MRADDAAAFVTWLNQRQSSSQWRYRFPTITEVAAQPIPDMLQTCWRVGEGGPSAPEAPIKLPQEMALASAFAPSSPPRYDDDAIQSDWARIYSEAPPQDTRRARKIDRELLLDFISAPFADKPFPRLII